MKFRRLLLLGLVSLLLIALVGCGSGSEKSSDGGSGGGSEGEEVTLRISIWNNNPEGTKLEQEIFQVFEEQNPGVKIEVVTSPYNEYNQKIMTMAAGNEAPDLIWLQPAAFAEFVNNGLIVDLTDKMSELDTDEFLPGILELGQIDGKQYALIRDASAFQLGYNKDMFDEAGVPYPEDDWTWDDFIEIGKQLTKFDEDGRPLQFGIENYYTDEILVQNGARILSEDGSTVLVDSPEAIEAITFGRDLIHKHQIQPTAEQAQGISGGMFLSGLAAMKLMGPWDWKDTNKNADFAWDVVPLPAGKGGNVAAAAYLPIGISTQSEHPDVAWEFLKFLTYGEGQDIQMDKINAIPVVKRNMDQILDMEGAPDNAVSLVHMLEEGRTVQNAPYVPEYNEIKNKAQTVFDNINLNNLDPEPELKKLADEIREEFGKQ